jgi:hypothetical protein
MLFLLHTAVLEHVLEATHRSDLYLTSTRSRTLKMPTVNYRQAITKEVRDTWDLTGISKQSITHKLKQQNKKSSAAIKSALESLLESKTIILDSNRYSIPAEERSQEWYEEARIRNRIGEMSMDKLRARAKMLGLKLDYIPNNELKDTVTSTQIQMTKDGTMPEFYTDAVDAADAAAFRRTNSNADPDFCTGDDCCWQCQGKIDKHRS